MKTIGKSTLARSFFLAAAVAVIPLAYSPDAPLKERVGVAEACASHGNCCAKDGICDMGNDKLAVGWEHESWWQRMFGC